MPVLLIDGEEWEPWIIWYRIARPGNDLAIRSSQEMAHVLHSVDFYWGFESDLSAEGTGVLRDVWVAFSLELREPPLQTGLAECVPTNM